MARKQGAQQGRAGAESPLQFSKGIQVRTCSPAYVPFYEWMITSPVGCLPVAVMKTFAKA
jgi:hypothetical protein